MSNGSRRSPDTDGVIVEHTRIGAWLKCSAVDTRTGLEVSASGPVTDPTAVERLAIAKLKRALEKRR
jgi:hypothetical protein